MTTANEASCPEPTNSHPLMHLVRALLAGAIFVMFLQPKVQSQTHRPFFEIPEEHHIRSLNDPPERWEKYLSEKVRVERLNAPAEFGVLGALLTVAFALGRFSCCNLFKRLVGGLVGGALVGALAGLAGCWAQQTLVPEGVQSTTEITSKVHAILFAALGLGVGAIVGSFGRGLKSTLGGAISGAFGGGLAGLAYAIVTSLIPTDIHAESLIPTTLLYQLIWMGFGTGLLGLIIPIGARPHQPAAPSTPDASATNSTP